MISSDKMARFGSARGAGLVTHASPLDALLRQDRPILPQMINRDRFLKDVVDGKARSTSTPY
jgi:hypothetical protein